MKVKQHIPAELRFTLADFTAKFPDNDSCLEYLKEKRYPKGVAFCQKCKLDRKHYRVTGRPAYACDHCGKMISPMAGTIFEKSSTPLKTWFYAMYLMGSTRCGISAKQIQRETGVTYKTAWRIFKQVRSLLSEPDLRLEGSTVEVDETYVGGVRKFGRGRPMRGDKKKTPVIGLVERGGRAYAKVIPDTTAKTLVGIVRKRVIPGSVIYTDEAPAYNTVSAYRRYTHFRINHKHQGYVRGHIHTNCVEGLWSLLNRGIGGVYHSVSPAYLQTYLDEYCFRYNHRFEGNKQFNAILERVCERAS
jgi:transposase